MPAVSLGTSTWVRPVGAATGHQQVGGLPGRLHGPLCPAEHRIAAVKGDPQRELVE